MIFVYPLRLAEERIPDLSYCIHQEEEITIKTKKKRVSNFRQRSDEFHNL
jgi:hypothetical protein